MAERRARRRRRRSSGTLYITVIVALMLLAVIFGLSVFFKVSRLDVKGVSMYTEEEVIAASGIEPGDSIFFVNQSAAAIRIKKALAYADEVRISRNLPDTVTISVTESYPIASVSSGGSRWIIDKNAKILEKADAESAADTIEIRGAEPIMPSVGSTVSLEDSGGVKLRYMKAVLSEILSSGIEKDVTWLDVSNISNIKFDYLGRFTVELGKGDDLEDKFWTLKQLVAKKEEDEKDKKENEKGRIDLSKSSLEDKAYFIPD